VSAPAYAPAQIVARYRHYQRNAVELKDYRAVGWYAFHLDDPVNPYPAGSIAADEWTCGYGTAARENS
jgi:hypothetical protein